MTSTNKLIFMCLLHVLICSCKQQNKLIVVKELTKAGVDASSPYLTQDNHGNAVICWSEKQSTDSVYQLKYAVFNPDKNTFNPPISVPVSSGLNVNPECMGKVAFKADNTVITMFSKSFPEEKNPFAGAIYYSASSNNGKTWTPAQFLHSDTSHYYGRSFFDITKLNNGEVAATWLDGRFGHSIKGLALFFAASEKNKGFANETCLYKGTCECCKTDILVGDNGDIHIAYRGILCKSSLFAQQVRDMLYCYSKDNGKTFSKPHPISDDNWRIEGCPHTGPSLAMNNRSVNATWFTAGGNSGIYYASATNPGTNFGHRQLVSSSGKHPQMIGLKNGKIAIVYEEPVESSSTSHVMKEHDMSGMKMNHTTSRGAKIVLTIFDAGGNTETIDITNGEKADHHAVIGKTFDKSIIAWVREKNGYSTVCYAVRTNF